MGARRSFEVQPAASIEEHSCIRAVWEGASLGGALFGGKGTMDCYLPFSCPQWYDCVLSGSLTFSFAMPADKAAYINVPQEVYAALFVDKDAQQHQVSCVPLGESYPQSGETRYCSRAGQITIHGQSLAEAAGRPGPSVSCIAATFVAIDPGDWFNSQILGCDAIIRRTWAPGVAHAHPLINLVRTGRNVLASGTLHRICGVEPRRRRYLRRERDRRLARRRSGGCSIDPAPEHAAGAPRRASGTAHGEVLAQDPVRETSKGDVLTDTTRRQAPAPAPSSQDHPDDHHSTRSSARSGHGDQAHAHDRRPPLRHDVAIR